MAVGDRSFKGMKPGALLACADKQETQSTSRLRWTSGSELGAGLSHDKGRGERGGW